MLKVSITKELKNFTLEADFETGDQITAIIGPSGCGKSLTLQCIAGLQKPDSGEIILNKRTVFQSKNNINLKPNKRNIGYVFQDYALFPHLTIAQNIQYGLKREDKKNRRAKAMKMIDKLELAGYENHYPSQLSGGQKQRVALGRTLITEPDILLLDEPFSALDHHVKHSLEQELLHMIKENFSGTVLLVTHNMEEAYRLSDSVLIYHEGKVIQAGEKDDVLRKPKTTSAARIIGCKNIFPIHGYDQPSQEVTVGGVSLKTNEKPPVSSFSHIGIRGEDILFTPRSSQKAINQFDFSIKHIVAGIYQTQAVIEIGSIMLEVVISEQMVNTIEGKQYQAILPPGKIFFLNDQ
ncbi:sulfate/molybdate ABC transporter ATP-binding protein [Bacillus sp. FJAT-44742]|uniref:sulfate/molybdate ABC transporter ATP-binding protein n=1 Tax=Bacillus sp. FJAT-44742 TaxID=2014005 RepID=UPI000C23B418|nr:sulfate/molybdate ABC transporter ATP-binding protein [Bacillus sp. FJAT-44742]